MKIRSTIVSGSAVLAAALAVSLPAQAGTSFFLQIVPTSASAGDIINGTTVTITGPGDQITYNIYANIEDDATTPSNCYFELSELSITSTAQSATTTQGTFAINGSNAASPGVVSFNTALDSNVVSLAGYETDGWNCSLNPPTVESLVNSVGGTAPTNNNSGPASQGGGQRIYLSTGTNGFQNPLPTDVTIAGVAYAQINLGQFTWVASQTGTGQNSATIALGGRAVTSGPISTKEIEKYVSDGTTELLTFGSTLVTFGSSEVVVLPEPASLTLLAMVLAALKVRARGLARLPGPE